MALVELENVTKRFGPARSPATDGLSFTVESGRILALLGPSGCCKTTTLRLIAGFETPDQGRIAIAGRTVADAERGIHVEPAPGPSPGRARPARGRRRRPTADRERGRSTPGDREAGGDHGAAHIAQDRLEFGELPIERGPVTPADRVVVD